MVNDCQRGSSELETLQWAEKVGIKQASPVYASLLRHCCSTRSLGLGKLVHRSIQRAGHGNDTFLSNLLLQMYGELGRIDDARSVFDAIPEKNVFSGNLMISAYARSGHRQQARLVFENMPDKNTVSWNSIIGALAQGEEPSKAMTYFWRMNLEGFRPSSVTFLAAIDACTKMEDIGHGRSNAIHAAALSCEGATTIEVMNALINMYGKQSRVLEAREVFDSIAKRARDVVSWNSIIAAYAQNDYLDQAKEAFDAMNIDRNTVTWNTMISAYAQSSTACALILLASMDQQGIHPNPYTFVIAALTQGRLLHSSLLDRDRIDDYSRHHLEVGNSIIHMYGSCGCAREADEALRRMDRRDVVSWSSLVAAHVQAGDASTAVTIFREMAMDGVRPNGVTFLAVLNAVADTGKVAQGWSLFVSMESDYELVPGLDHLVCVVDLFARAGLLDQAELIALSSSFSKSSVPWIALLSACKDGNGGVASTAMELNAAKSSSYVLVSNAFVR